MGIRHYAAALASALLAVSPAAAASFTFSGNLVQDNSRASYVFDIAAPATVTLTSLGYAGGTSVSGQTFAAGGFDTVLSLYNQFGSLVADNDDGATVGIDPVTGFGSDAQFSGALEAGIYTVFLTQYANFGPLQLPGEFAFDDEPNFTGGFRQFDGTQRTAAFALDITGVDSAAPGVGPIPEPATWAMMIAGFALVGAAARRRRSMLTA